MADIEIHTNNNFSRRIKNNLIEFVIKIRYSINYNIVNEEKNVTEQ